MPEALAWLTQAATTPTRDKDGPGTGRGVQAGTRRSGTCQVIRSAVTTGFSLLGGLFRGHTAGWAQGGGTGRESSCTLRWGGSAATAQLGGGQILAVVWPGICLLLLEARVFDAFDRLESINGSALPVITSLERSLSLSCWQCRAVHQTSPGQSAESRESCGTLRS